MMNRGNTTLWVIISILIIAIVGSAVYFLQNKGIEGPVVPGIDTKKEKDMEIKDKDMNTVILKTNMGDITIELFRNDAPNTADNFEELSKAGFYNETRFHRVIDGFMIQGGDPQSKDISLQNVWGTGGPGYQFEDEIHANNRNLRGTISMANSGPNTNGSQFFINTVDNSGLDQKHTVFGRVVDGMDVVDAIGSVETGVADRPVNDVVIKSVEVK